MSTYVYCTKCGDVRNIGRPLNDNTNRCMKCGKSDCLINITEGYNVIKSGSALYKNYFWCPTCKKVNRHESTFTYDEHMEVYCDYCSQAIQLGWIKPGDNEQKINTADKTTVQSLKEYCESVKPKHKHTQHPDYYMFEMDGKQIQIGDVLRSLNFSPWIFNAITYLWRFVHKNGVKDLNKAITCIRKERMALYWNKKTKEELINEELSDILKFYGWNMDDIVNWYDNKNK